MLYNKIMILSKSKKISLLVLLVLVSFVLSAIKFIFGEKTSRAQAACWTVPSGAAASSDSGMS